MSKYEPAGGSTYNLQSSIGSTDSSFTLSSFLEPVTGTPYTMALLNTSIVYFTIAPKTTGSEFVSGTTLTQNADGTCTVGGVTRGLAKKYPFTSDSAYKLPHSGQTQVIMSDAPQVFQKYLSVDNDETINGLITFAQPPVGVNPGGQPDASTTVKGVGKVSVAPVSPTSPVFVGDNDTRVPTVNMSTVTAGEVLALAGTSGTPTTGNEYVTAQDVSNAGVSSKIVRMNGTTYPAGNGSGITNVAAATTAAATKFSFITTPVTVSSSTAETALITASLPGGTLSTANGIRIKGFLSAFRLENNTNTATFRFKYGSTTLSTIVITESGANSVDQSGHFDAMIYATGATGTQKGSFALSLFGLNTSNNTLSGPIGGGGTNTGTATEDSTGTLSLIVTVQFSNNGVNTKVTLDSAVLEKIY